MSKRDYYETLGVSRNANAAALKNAYRKLAMKYHPDRNPGDKDAEQKFKEVSEAYDVLRDEQKRAAYDRFGHDAFTQGGMGGGAGPSGARGFGGFSDIFEEMFGDIMGGAGGRRSQTQSGRGSDLRHDLEISLEDAFHGRSRTIRVHASAPCETCHGTGAKDGASPTTCVTCHGRGKVRTQQGFFTLERTCPICHGQGSVIDEPCATCGGGGRVRKDKTLSVNIPAGVEDGTRIRLSGEGEAGVRGAPPGDLYIFLTIAPHRIFQREGAHIFCEVPISMVEAALGGGIEVPTIEGGRARVKIPEGAQSGQRFRLRGKGMTAMRGRGRGDMFIELNVETPVRLTARQKELLREFRKEGGGKSQSPESEGFFAKVKEFWDDLTE